MATRNVVLTPHQEQVIHDLVQSGRYQNASEVMREGLRLLEQRVAEDTAKIEALRTGPSQRSPRLFTPAGQTNQGTVKNPRHIVFYRGANDDVIEVVRLLHDAMEVQLHLPND